MDLDADFYVKHTNPIKMSNKEINNEWVETGDLKIINFNSLSSVLPLPWGNSRNYELDLLERSPQRALSLQPQIPQADNWP